MSELIERNVNRIAVRRQFMATVSATALMAYAASGIPAIADEGDRPTVWIELGGQLEMLQGTSSPFIAPFMTLTPTPAPYGEAPPITSQQPKNTAWGFEGALNFQPEDSDWTFSAGVRYGRSQTKRHTHQQSNVPSVVHPYTYNGNTYTRTFGFVVDPFADTKLRADESHVLLDFTAGKDVGLGSFGRSGQSIISAGVRFAQFSAKMRVDSYARPMVGYKIVPLPNIPISLPVSYFHAYTMHASAERSFRGIGPTMAWKASATLLGNEHVHLDADWGINGALLFGRQKAKTSHSTAANYQTGVNYTPRHYVQAYPTRFSHRTRSRSLMVPNIGGFAGVSVKYPNVKISLGYRADFFFGAMDTGIDTAKRTTTGFHGPFVNVGIGL
jgi:hypothetical protein